MNYIVYCLVSLSLPLCLVESSRILAFMPFPAKSHHKIIVPLVKELSLRGHHVTFYTALPIENPPDNLRQIKLKHYFNERRKNVSSSQWKEAYTWTTGFFMPFSFLLYKYHAVEFNKWVLDLKEVKELINSNEKYDAVIMETMMLQEPFIALGHKFNAPVIEIMVVANFHWVYWVHGTPFDTSYIADTSLDYTDRMSFGQRLINTMVSCFLRFGYHILTPRHEAVMNERIRYQGWEDRPSMMDMVVNVSLVLLNTHYSINYPYPLAPHVKEISGINIQPPQSLPKDLQKFVDEAKNGFILFSFGSSIGVSSLLTDQQRDIFAKVFSELNLKVLWKWEKEFPNLPKNIMINKWFPQQELLDHKNIRMFITHGGTQSLIEAINYAVPTLGIPIVTDQYRYIRIASEVFKCTYTLNFNNITYETLKYAVNEVLQNPMYKENSIKRSVIFKDRQQTPLETAVYWTEYVIRHRGAEHLRPAIASMPWYQQAMIDVYSAMAAILLIQVYISYTIFRCICRKLTRKNIKKTTKKKKK